MPKHNLCSNKTKLITCLKTCYSHIKLNSSFDKINAFYVEYQENFIFLLVSSSTDMFWSQFFSTMYANLIKKIQAEDKVVSAKWQIYSKD